MNLSNRQFLLISILSNEKKPISAKELASILNISPRTLRYDISGINSEENENIIISSKQGYYLNSNHKIHTLLNNLHQDNSHEIVKYIALDLLSNNECSVYDFCEKAYISESTVYKLIKSLIPEFYKFNLQIIRKGQMYSVIGEENNRRTAIAHYIYSDANELATCLNNFNNYFSNFSLNDIYEIVVNNFKKFELSIEDIYLKNIVITIAISAQRILDGYPSELLDKKNDPLEFTLQKKILTSICSDIKKDLGISIENSDFQNLLLFLTGLIKDCNLEGNKSIVNDKEFKSKIDRIFKQTYSHFGLDFNSYLSTDNLYVHIYFMLLRLESNNSFKNNVSNSIRKSHPFIYDITVYLSFLISEEFHVTMNEYETGLLAIYLGTFISSFTTFPKSKVILVCLNYHGIKELTIQQINSHFSDKIEIIKTVSSFDEIRDNDYFDFIISNIPHNGLNKDTIFIETFLTNYDLKKIDDAIIHNINMQKHKAFKNSVMPYFDSDLFFYNYPLTNGKDILNMINKILLEKKIVNEDYLQSVYQREELSSTAFYEQFALAHSLDVLSNKSIIVYYYSETPIDWFGTKIHLLLVLVSSGYTKSFGDLYNILIDILMEKNMYNHLICAKNLEEMIQYLESKY